MKHELSSSQWSVSKSNGMPMILATQQMSAERHVLSDCLLVLVSRWWGSVRYHCCHALAPPPCTCMAGIQQVGACSARAIPSHAQPSWQTTAECWTYKKKWGPQKRVFRLNSFRLVVCKCLDILLLLAWCLSNKCKHFFIISENRHGGDDDMGAAYGHVIESKLWIRV